MKKYLIVTLITFINCAKLCGQDSKTLAATPQLYVINADNKKFITDSNGIDIKATESGAIKNGVVYINPNWIENISLIKGKDAIDKYGSQGKNGVVLFQLRNGALKEMAKKSRNRFKS